MTDYVKDGAAIKLFTGAGGGVDVLTRFRDGIQSLQDDGYLAEVSTARIALTREALLRVDVLLPRFFLPQHAGIRYT